MKIYIVGCGKSLPGDPISNENLIKGLNLGKEGKRDY